LDPQLIISYISSLIFTPTKYYKNGWWRLEHEEVLAPTPAEESGAWIEEKALEEKKRLDQLRKEKEEERQLQELQRLQEE